MLITSKFVKMFKSGHNLESSLLNSFPQIKSPLISLQYSV